MDYLNANTFPHLLVVTVLGDLLMSVHDHNCKLGVVSFELLGQLPECTGQLVVARCTAQQECIYRAVHGNGMRRTWSPHSVHYRGLFHASCSLGLWAGHPLVAETHLLVVVFAWREYPACENQTAVKRDKQETHFKPAEIPWEYRLM